MSPTRDWALKAEGDLRAMRAILKAGDDLMFDAVCFHAQQCIEKLLKGILQSRGQPVPKTHDLRVLLKPLVSELNNHAALLEQCAILSEYAVGFRYPGEIADAAIANEASSIAEHLYTYFSDLLPKDQLDLPF